MAGLTNAFDSNEHDDMNVGFKPIPAGEYPVQIVKSDLVPVKDKPASKFIKFEFSIIDGEYKGSKIWQQLNIINSNKVTSEIANKELATICRAVGKTVIHDTDELHGIPLLMTVKIIPAKGDWPAKNGPTGYKRMETAATKAATKKSASKPRDTEEGEEVPWGN